MSATDRLFGIPGRVAAVIGATPIGLATAKLLEEAGATAVLVRTRFEGSEGDLDPVDETAVAAALQQIVAGNGGLDIVVYAVTVPGVYSFQEMTLAQWDHQQDANVRGAFICLREALPHLKARGGGRIVAISTIGAVHPVLHGNTAYGASRAGLNAMVRAVALDHAKDGVLANVVLCGAFPVGPMPADSGVPSGPGRDAGRLMLGMAEPEIAAAAVLYLVSPAGRFTTGQALPLDGGFLVS